jgi:membrane protein DedA with SNARE-associated domain
MSMALINHLLQAYGYLAVFLFVALASARVLLPGETALIAAALYAGSAHRLNVGLIALVAAVAAIADGPLHAIEDVVQQPVENLPYDCSR